MTGFKKIFALILLFGLNAAWIGQVFHLVLVPHHYCEQHEEFVHEHHNSHAHENGKSPRTNIHRSLPPHTHDHCSVASALNRLVTSLPQAEVISVVGLSEVYFSPKLHHADGSDKYSFAPKNSPPVFLLPFFV